MVSRGEIESASTCPNCGKTVDPLRAPAVSIVAGRMVHFCSGECRERHLRGTRQDIPPPPLAGTASGSPDAAGSSSVKTGGLEPEPSHIAPQAATTGERSPLRLPPSLLRQIVFVLAAGVWFIAVASAPPLFSGRLPLLLVGLPAAALLVLRVVRERGLGVARMLEAAAEPLAALIILGSAFFGIEPRAAALGGAGLLFAQGAGRALEILGRFRSAILSVVQGEPHPRLSTSWRDNSAASARVHLWTQVLEAARYPAAILAALAVYLFGSRSLSEALIGGTLMLVALAPRALRMATGDVHLSAALAAANEGAKIRDASVVDRLGRCRMLVFIAKRSLLEDTLSMVGFKVSAEADERALVGALVALERKAEGRMADAIARFLTGRPAHPATALEVERRPGLGILGRTSLGDIACGARSLLLAEGISTAELEPHAKAIESSGRRAVFVALDGRAVAAFGAEETVLPGAHEAIQAVRALGMEPIMLTSAEVDAACALGERLGIDIVRFETAEEKTGVVLSELAETGEEVAVIGHGAPFEESMQAAAVAIAVGPGGPTQAGVDLQGLPLSVLPVAVSRALHAKKSVERNLIAASAAMLLGLALFASWLTPGAAAFSAACGFAAAAFCTINSPYPTATRLLERAASSGGRILRRIARLLRIG